MVAALPLKKTGTDANVQLRGVTPRALAVHDKVKIVEGRFFTPGLFELIGGEERAGCLPRAWPSGDSVKLGGADWKVVGSFDAGGSAFDSEIWLRRQPAERDLPAADRHPPVGGGAAGRSGDASGRRWSSGWPPIRG